MPAAVLCCSDIGDAEPAGMVLSYLLRRNGRVYRQLDARLGEGVRCIDCTDELARWIVIADSDGDSLTLPSMSRTTVAYAPPPGALCCLPALPATAA